LNNFQATKVGHLQSRYIYYRKFIPRVFPRHVSVALGITSSPSHLLQYVFVITTFIIFQSCILYLTCQVHEHLREYNVSLSTFLKTFANATSPQRVTPSLAIIRNFGSEPETFLLQTKRWPGVEGKWELPGVWVDWYSQETILHTLQREVREETGLEVANSQR
jgi:hypothetical protein